MYKYRVVIEPLAEDDIVRNIEYVAYEKKSPGAAGSLLKGLRKEIASLAINLQRHMLVDSKALLLRIVKE